MTDLKTEVSQAEQTAKTTAQAFEQKQVGWVRRNAVALAIGFVLGFLARCIL